MAASDADREIVIVREFAAPRRLVWQAFTDPAHVAKWFGPRGFTTRVEQLDLRPGGRTKYVMVGPDGGEYPCGGTFLEIVPGERIVSTDEFGDDFVAPPGVDLPQGMVTTYLFDDLPGGKTRLTLRIAHPTAADKAKHEAMGVVGGWQSSFDKLAELFGETPSLAVTLPSPTEIVLTREFAAPRQLVFDALTKPEHVRQWWGLRGSELTTCEADIRVGGTWRYVLKMPTGQECRFHGEYLELDPPGRMVSTETFDEPAIGSPSYRVTVTLTEADGRTTLVSRIQHPTPEARDGHLGSGMPAGAAETFDRLAELLARG